MDRVTVDTETGCWNWLGYKQQGYGRATVRGRRQMVHRFFYEDIVGPVPDGLVLDHLCRNRACVHPGHLEPVLNTVNIMRGEGFYAREARKTHCPQNHPYDDENTYWFDGRRYCLECKRAYERETMRRRRAKQRASNVE
jgi:hypothetical protein